MALKPNEDLAPYDLVQVLQDIQEHLDEGLSFIRTMRLVCYSHDIPSKYIARIVTAYEASQ